MPNNVHDALFKATFSQIEHAASELKLVLPPGLVANLAVLLVARFGGLSNAVTARVNSADSTELDVWTERVLTAGTLAEVLGDV